ncbi:hypothetical protein B296_00022843 [Ensete ventricosum]|uniref:Uncharacterized protein n=1 Tax=Ensete ventricosum TaxID=4639 RepID=A0A427AI78_ENSVE|nr:hypothetical protein B296_00022843 [Ensete ventricosum]
MEPQDRGVKEEEESGAAIGRRRIEIDWGMRGVRTEPRSKPWQLRPPALYTPGPRCTSPAEKNNLVRASPVVGRRARTEQLGGG